MTSTSQGPGSADRLNWTLFLFVLLLGLPFGGYIRALFGNSPVGRLTLQDAAFAVLAISLGWRFWRLLISWDVALAALLNLGIVVSMLANGKSGWAEVAVHLYLLVMYLVVRNMMGCRQQRRTLHRGLLAAFFVAFAAAVVSKVVAVPWLPQHSLHLQGAFLNGSQYGSFMLVSTVPIYAAAMCLWLGFPMGGELPTAGNWYRRALVTCCLVAPPLLLLASKRAALLSLLFSSGVAWLFAMRYRSVRTLRGMLWLGIILIVLGTVVATMWGDEIVELDYFLSRLSSGLSQIDAGDQFFMNNVRSAWAAFLDQPLFGAGYGGTVFRFGREQYEIHSTYLKWLGSGGLVVALPGFLLMGWTAYGLFRRGYRDKERYAVFLLIFFAGLLLAMVYSYLPRRREFWVVLAYLNAYAASQPSHAASVSSEAT